MIDVPGLRVLVAVADEGSLTSAAAKLSYSQSAVSRRVQGLERDLGVAMFRRSSRGVEPTRAGEVAVDLARDVLVRLDDLEATVRSHSGLEGGELRIAGFSSVNTAFVPDAIRRYQDAHPGVTVTLHQVDPFLVRQAVRDGQVDVALLTDWQLVDDPFVARDDEASPADSVDAIEGVEVVPLMDEELRLALPSNHRLARRRRVPLAELQDEQWIDGAFPDCLGPLRPLADALGSAPKIGFVIDDWNGKQALVAAGAGVMVVPASARAALREGLVVRSTAPSLPPRRLYVAAARPPHRTAAASAMVTQLIGEEQLGR